MKLTPTQHLHAELWIPDTASRHKWMAKRFAIRLSYVSDKRLHQETQLCFLVSRPKDQSSHLQSKSADSLLRNSEQYSLLCLCFYLLDHYYKHNLINSDSTASIASCWIAIQSYEMSHQTSLEIRNAIPRWYRPRWYRGKRDRWLYGLRKQYQPTTTQQLSIVTRNSCVPQIQMDREYDRQIEPQSSYQSSSLVQPQSPPWLFNKSLEV